MRYVTSLDPLTSGPCPGVRRIDISNSAVFEIAKIGSFVDLERFTAWQTLIVDANPLAKCRMLREINLDLSPVLEIEQLFGLRHLEYLSLDYTNVRQLPSKFDCKELKVLNIRRTQIQESSLKPYAGIEIGIEL